MPGWRHHRRNQLHSLRRARETSPLSTPGEVSLHRCQISVDRSPLQFRYVLQMRPVQCDGRRRDEGWREGLVRLLPLGPRRLAEGGGPSQVGEVVPDRGEREVSLLAQVSPVPMKLLPDSRELWFLRTLHGESISRHCLGDATNISSSSFRVLAHRISANFI